jgi:excisionase family DNA binding protein
MISTKIAPKHLARSAYVYVRQSTSYQVQHHVESKQRQYELSKVALHHGWPNSRIVVIDADLGRSASSADGRTGFQRLVSDVALGRAGIVLGLEVSRLARNNRDWYQLLDLCALRETLIADTDGVYDPAAYNDRLLLGLKGTMSEAELHILRGRMAAGLRHKAAKGALRFRLVPGYEFDGDEIVKTSDEKVSQFVSTLFAKVFEIGSVSGVTKFFLHAELKFPRRVASDGSIRWVTPYYRGMYMMLTNPIYAGAYAYGRTETVVDMDADARVTTRRRAKPMAKWDVLLQDHHPAYVSWDDFVQLGRLLEKNRPAHRDEASLALREGGALLQGLARCGECGRSMKMRYHGAATGKRYASYICDLSQQQMKASQCRSVGARRIDDAISRLFLAAVSSASVEIEIAALRKLDEREDAVLRQIELQLESARYEAGRAERQYDAVEPENRVVARSLESRWNAALERVQQLELQLEDRKRQIAKRLSDDEERHLKELAHNLPGLWTHELVSDKDRKALLRAAIEEVQIRKQTPERVHLKVVWKGGALDELTVEMPRKPPSSTPTDLVELVRTLATKYDDAQIARVLARRRIKTPKKKIAFTAHHVSDLRRKYGIPRCPERASEEATPTYTVEQAARLFGVSGPTIYSWLKLGILHGEQITASAPWSIEITDAERSRLSASSPPGWLSLKEASAELGVSKQTILNWVKAGKVEFVYVTHGRRRGLRIDGESAPYRAQQNLVD